MKLTLFISVVVTLFFSLSSSHFTPALVVNHDKLAHFIVFLVLSCCMHISFPKLVIKKIIFILMLLAFGIEIGQHTFANRELSFVDFSASVTGVFTYFIFMKILVRKYNILERTKNMS